MNKGEWEAIGTEIVSSIGSIITETDEEEDAQLICAAVNACIKVNPNNPQAVADSIVDMYEALKSALFLVKDFDKSLVNISLGKSIHKIEQALSKAEGKE